MLWTLMYHTEFVQCHNGEGHAYGVLDIINRRAEGFLALFAGDTGEIKPELQTPRSRNGARRARPRSFLMSSSSTRFNVRH
ncbi:hypothetical protein EDD85DRAFT_233189 [Armillaria nabsnona]|nr:hypothetical protein EDD85DRAFT_233189 [Armillaria nabsnona]